MKRNFLEIPPFYHTPEAAAQTSSVLTHKNGYDWLLDHYLSVYFLKTNTHSIVESFFDADKLWDCPFVEYSSVFRRDLLLNSDIIQFLKKLILQGNYIYLLIDYYYVKTSSIYEKQHLGHSALLSGYDNSRKIFLYSDFSVLYKNK